MEDFLARLIFDNVKNNKDIDDKFIERVIEIVIQNWNISNYKGDYKIVRLDRGMATYNYYRNCLTINYDLLDDISKIYNFVSLGLLQKYQFVLQVLLHELKHCSQFDITSMSYNNLEKLIIYSENSTKIKICKNRTFTNPDSIKHLNLKQKYYSYSPMERIAEIDSSKVVKNVSKILNDDYTNDIMNFNIFYNNIRGYDYKDGKLIPPTLYYLSMTKCDKHIKRIIKLGNSEGEKNKLRFGLDVNEDYFLETGKEFESYYKKVKKYIINKNR